MIDSERLWISRRYPIESIFRWWRVWTSRRPASKCGTTRARCDQPLYRDDTDVRLAVIPRACWPTRRQEAPEGIGHHAPPCRDPSVPAWADAHPERPCYRPVPPIRMPIKRAIRCRTTRTRRTPRRVGAAAARVRSERWTRVRPRWTHWAGPTPDNLILEGRVTISATAVPNHPTALPSIRWI